MVGQRLKPEELLERSEAEERKEKRGKLKIYLGAAPGVGKTYAMLHDALEKRESDLDVVIGIAESHGRHEIESLLKKFETIPRQIVHYRGTTCQEFDFDAALRRRPGLILIDEMAHSNAPGLRHSKRWQDIKEFLDRGIDVYTTLNVQHIESLKDDVVQIIQAPVRETVPDSMIEMATTIEVVDLPLEDLLKRLHDGKIYIPQQAEQATEHFFRKGNLIALRELALRTTAERVGTDVLLYRQSEGIKRIWPTKDKILVCVGSRLESLKLIRAAKRIVNSLQADWVAVYVDTPHMQQSTAQRNSAIQNLRLAEQLGAVTHVLTGFDIVKVLMEFAREQNVTQIMLRKQITTRWRGWLRRSLVDEIVRHSGEIDVYIMTGEANEPQVPKQQMTLLTPWKTYGVALMVTALATLFNFVLYPYIAESTIVMVYMLSLVIIARQGVVGVSIFASVLSVIAYDFFFVLPLYSFSIPNNKYSITITLMLIVAQVISYLTILTRRQAESARFVQYQTTALFTLSRQLTKTRGVEKLIALGATYIADAFNCDVMVLLPKKHQLEVQFGYPAKIRLDVKEKSIAQWVYEMRQIAGLGTDTLSFSKALYIPLSAALETIGVLRIQPRTQELFTPEQMELLESCINQVALALEVDRMNENKRRQELKMKTEKARIAILEAISKDLETPLNIIVEAASALKATGGEKIKTLSNDIDYEIRKLSRLNNNISRIIQLESQDIKLKKKLTSLKTVLNDVLKMFKQKLNDRHVHLLVSPTLPRVSLSREHIQEVFINLIDNATKFTPAKSSITISIHAEKDRIIVSIEDEGPGVALEEKSKLFEKFYRGKKLTTVRGLGLGLTICYKIIEAHGGSIWVENLEKKGAAFRFSLPIK